MTAKFTVTVQIELKPSARKQDKKKSDSPSKAKSQFWINLFQVNSK